MMFHRFAIALVLVIVCSRALTVHGQAFTYQGQLKDANGPVNGKPTLLFKLFDAPSGGNQLGNAALLSAHPVTQGQFTVNLDFGAGNHAFFTGDPRFLEVTVNGAPLTPRQPLWPAPYALRAMRPWQTSNADANDIFFSGNVPGDGQRGHRRCESDGPALGGQWT